MKALWEFLQETLWAEREELDRQGVRLSVSGALERLPSKVTGALDDVVKTLAGNTGLVLNLALAYGGRQEIIHAALRLAERLEAGEITPDAVDETEFAKGLYTPDLPDPDLVVRTSGEARLSNFLLWQSAYSEILITPVLWPDFGKRELLMAVADYQNRERRFGGLPGAPAEPSPLPRTSSGARLPWVAGATLALSRTPWTPSPSTGTAATRSSRPTPPEINSPSRSMGIRQ